MSNDRSEGTEQQTGPSRTMNADQVAVWGAGCGVSMVCWAGLVAVLTVWASSYIAGHPALLPNKPGWAEGISFLSGFLTFLIGFFGAIPLGYVIRGWPRTWPRIAAAWLAILLLIVPALTITAALALTVVPWRMSCGIDPQHCTYLQQHPWAILAVIGGAGAGIAVFRMWWTRRRPAWAGEPESGR